MARIAAAAAGALLAAAVAWSLVPALLPPPGATVVPGPSPTPDATATPAPPRPSRTLLPSAPEPAAPTPPGQRPLVDLRLFGAPAERFITEIRDDWCAVAATQIVLAAHDRAPLTAAWQTELAGRIGEWESVADSRSGGWGPEAIARALAANGVPGYAVRVYPSRAVALREAARAIAATGAPAVLLAWRGAHAWVMAGYTAVGDPAADGDAVVTGAYVLDPWYPRVSSIWGPSDPPGTFQDAAELVRNYLPWRRPDGRYPDRDGRFVAIVPTRLAAP